MTNEVYGSMSHGVHKSDIDVMIRDGRFLDTLDRRGSGMGSTLVLVHTGIMVNINIILIGGVIGDIF